MKFYELRKLLKARLSSAGSVPSIDKNGNTVYTDYDVFGEDSLDAFLTLSLSHFNQTPKFTLFTFDNEKFIDTFASILVDGAVINALSSQSLLEKGREFTIIENGISMDPPSVSEIMQSQWSTMFHSHHEKIRDIKINIKDFSAEG